MGLSHRYRHSAHLWVLLLPVKGSREGWRLCAGKDGLTFPAPITFSAAYTALEQRGQRSEPPNLENLLLLELEGAACGLDLEQKGSGFRWVCW